MKCLVSLLGRLAADPELVQLQDGRRVAVLAVTTEETWTDEEGARRARPTTHRVVIRQSGRAKAAARDLRAGDLVDLTGTLVYPGEAAGQTAQVEIQVRAAFHTLLFVETSAGS